EDSTMKEFLELMRKRLGLPETATEEELLTAANSAFAQIDGTYGTTLVAGQSFTDAFVKAIEAKSAANNSQTPDPTKYVPIAVYQE
ncbi:phage protease, partial [Acinetobacter baumannii]|nr:phage protease [Acinetobacter baumannii]